MAKSVRLLDSKSLQEIHVENRIVNYALCIICQQDTAEKLLDPSASKRIDKGIGYHSFAEDLVNASTLCMLPISIKLGQLDNEESVTECLKINKAVWHKSCRLKFNKTEIKRMEKRQSSTDRNNNNECKENSIKRLRSSFPTSSKERATADVCFFCDTCVPGDNLRQAQTFGLDSRVRSAALRLNDTKLLGKLSVGDMIATEAKYHASCLVSLYKRLELLDQQERKVNNNVHNIHESEAFAELVTYIEEARCSQDVNPVFKLSDLVKLYNERLKQLSLDDVVTHVHSTRLKEKLLAFVPGLIAHSSGRDVVLTFQDNVGSILSTACSSNIDYDNDALCLARAAQIVRRELFECEYKFDGTIQRDAQRKSVPLLLITLIEMILEGPSIKQQNEGLSSQPALSISQLIKFNSVHQRRRHDKEANFRHALQQETPLPVYISMMLHAATRKKKVIDKLFELGLCVSYQRMQQLCVQVSNAVCNVYKMQDVVSPPSLIEKTFTTAAVDNIDHNPRSTTSTDSFHGTSISLCQHPNVNSEGYIHNDLKIENTVNTVKLEQLPQYYSNILPVNLPQKCSPADATTVFNLGPSETYTEAQQTEYRWLQSVLDKLDLDMSHESANISWSAYHANLNQYSAFPRSTSTLLPLFHEQAHSPSTMRHSMDVIRKAVQYINPGQVPVICCDQPLFAICKQIQWTWPSDYGEERIVIMLGGLHVEMAMLKCLGQWLDNSGWVDLLVQSNIASAGVAEAFIHASHVKRSRYAHEVTAASLYILKMHAFEEYKSSSGELINLADWSEMQSKKFPQFAYWNVALAMEIHLLLLVRSFREGNFELYVEALQVLAAWFFALDHTHYARWLPIHIRDMKQINTKHPSVAIEFKAGKFVVQKTDRSFSAISLDQAHEQMNKLVKGDGGIIGLTNSQSALNRWTICGPEISRLVHEFEGSNECSTHKEHHEQSAKFQEKFQCNVKALIDRFECCGNPFSDESGDLYALSSNNIADPSVVHTLHNIFEVGVQQYEKFIHERLFEKTKDIHDTIPQNKFPLFKDKPHRVKNATKEKLTASKTDCNLFANLFIACQNRRGDLVDFFAHENQAFPPSISDAGEIRFGTKSDLIGCLETLCDSSYETPTVSAVIIDGAAVVHGLKPSGAKTFQEYACNIFLPHICKLSTSATRIDIVWDEYIHNSLKAAARSTRGSGNRKRILSDVVIPANWAGFLRIDENKKGLFSYLSQAIVKQVIGDRKIFATDGENVLHNTMLEDLSTLAPCNHEEADTRLIIHVADAARHGHRKVMIRSVDTDVIVIATAAFSSINNIEELWVAFGTGKSYRYIPIHQYVAVLGAKSSALPFFHAFSGCDTVSSFSGRGKKTAWDTWNSFPEATATFSILSSMPSELSATNLLTLERFVNLMYDRTSTFVSVNDGRQYLFTKKNRAMDGIPPSQAALLQHAKRGVYQAGYVWRQCLILQQVLPDPGDWGWTMTDDKWRPLWTKLQQASRSCNELIKCKCKNNSCLSHCKCRKASLQCTALCLCDGLCSSQN